MPIVSINAEFLKNHLHCPAGKARIEYVPDDMPGMYLLVTATTPGEGCWFYRYKNQTGKTCHIKIGRTTEIGLTEAKKQAIKLKSSTSSGGDPRGQQKADQAVITLDKFFTDHYLPFVQPRKRSWKRDEELYRLRIQPKFGHLRLNQIERKEVQTFHTSILKMGLSPATADHHIKLLKFMMNTATNWNMITKNPLSGLKLFNEYNNVENIPSEQQTADLIKVLKTDANRSVCLIVMFLMSTGCRLNEALQAKWEHINLIDRIWRVPQQNAKSKKPRSVPLNDSAIYVLEQLTTKGNHDFLFVNEKTKSAYTTIQKTWSRIRKKAGLPNFRAHDARHLFASLLVNDGRTLYDVQHILGHSDPRVTQRYAHLSAKRLQEAANSASVIVRAGEQG